MICPSCGQTLISEYACKLCGWVKPKDKTISLRCSFKTNGYQCKMLGGVIIGGDSENRKSICSFHFDVLSGEEYTREAFVAWHKKEMDRIGSKRNKITKIYERALSGKSDLMIHLKNAGLRMPDGFVIPSIDSPVVKQMINASSLNQWCKSVDYLWHKLSGDNAPDRILS